MSTPSHTTDAQTWQLQAQNALLKINKIVREMDQSENLEQVTRSFFTLLQSLNIDFQILVIHFLLDAQNYQFVSYQFPQTQKHHFEQYNPKMYDFFRANQQRYRKDLEVNLEGLSSLKWVRERYQCPIRSTLDLPFATGVLSLLSIHPDPFTDLQITLILEMTEVLSTGVKRAQDLSRLETQNQSLKNYSSRLQHMSQLLVQVQENERRALARELHDEIGQALTSIKIDLQMQQELGKQKGIDLTDSIQTVNNTLEQVRGLSLNLRPSILDDFGLNAALRWFVDRHQKLDTKIDLIFNAQDQRYPEHVETACFRIVQEALVNALRHAQSTHITIHLTSTQNALTLQILDDGIGFNVLEAQKNAFAGQSSGLLNIQERTELLGGTVKIVSTPQQGTSIYVDIPITPNTTEKTTNEAHSSRIGR